MNEQKAFDSGPKGERNANSSYSAELVYLYIKGQDTKDQADDQFQPNGETEALARIVAQVLKRLGITDVPS